MALPQTSQRSAPERKTPIRWEVGRTCRRPVFGTQGYLYYQEKLEGFAPRGGSDRLRLAAARHRRGKDEARFLANELPCVERRYGREAPSPCITSETTFL